MAKRALLAGITRSDKGDLLEMALRMTLKVLGIRRCAYAHLLTESIAHLGGASPYRLFDVAVLSALDWRSRISLLNSVRPAYRRITNPERSLRQDGS